MVAGSLLIDEALYAYACIGRNGPPKILCGRAAPFEPATGQPHAEIAHRMLSACGAT